MLKPKTHIWMYVVIWALITGFGIWFLNRTDPFQADAKQFALFYVLVFASIFSLMTVLGYAFRTIFWRSGVKYEFLRVSRRQGMLIGLMSGIVLVLKSFGVFSIYSGILLLLAFVFLEFYALARP